MWIYVETMGKQKKVKIKPLTRPVKAYKGIVKGLKMHVLANIKYLTKPLGRFSPVCLITNYAERKA